MIIISSALNITSEEQAADRDVIGAELTRDAPGTWKGADWKSGI